jgi:hypothetical protein
MGSEKVMRHRSIVRIRFAFASTLLAAVFFLVVGEPERIPWGFAGFGLFLFGVFVVAYLLVHESRG